MEETDNGIYRKKEKAQTMVEFALTLPILLMLFFGIFEFGRLLFYYGAVVTATREAARYGSATDDAAGVAKYNDCSGIRSAAKRIGQFTGIQDVDIVISYERPSAATNPFPGGCPAGAPVLLGDRINVTVTAHFDPIVPLINLPTIDVQSDAKRTIVKGLEINGQ
jgi:hypothetical protein